MIGDRITWIFPLDEVFDEKILLGKPVRARMDLDDGWIKVQYVNGIRYRKPSAGQRLKGSEGLNGRNGRRNGNRILHTFEIVVSPLALPRFRYRRKFRSLPYARLPILPLSP